MIKTAYDKGFEEGYNEVMYKEAEKEKNLRRTLGTSVATLGLAGLGASAGDALATIGKSKRMRLRGYLGGAAGLAAGGYGGYKASQKLYRAMDKNRDQGK